ncbi:hypothetical protein POTOM_029035 [Populus tomentosa]|uniref:Uncharacterized protein n=1 Tax=Populus tomentosa TaxID=118781 RepID=A0A8X8CJB3_POPTO|nr:hypothetical protein POTOM_029035 [Populus tomentosa]
MHSRSVVVTLVIRGKGGIDDFFDKVLGLLERKGLGDRSISFATYFVRIPLEKAGGMMNLIDIYCLLSRAPGTGLYDLLLLLLIMGPYSFCAVLHRIDLA